MPLHAETDVPKAMTDVRERKAGSLEWELVSIVVGVVSAALVIIALNTFLGRLYPVPGLNPLQPVEELRSQVAALPRTSYFLLLGAYAFASFVGGLAASLTAGRTHARPALVTGLILMIAGTYGVMVVYQPIWFRAVSFLTYSMAYLAHLLIRRRV
jgi:hypothetical protein